MTPEQLETLFRCMDADREIKDTIPGRTPSVQWLKDAVLISVNTGLRISELANLRWNDIDLDSGFLYVRSRADEGDGAFQPKSHHERAVPLVADARRVLERLSSERADDLDGPVLLTPTGKPLNVETLSKRFKHYICLAKLPESIHWHTLRHTATSWLAMRGVPLRVIQEVLGHSTTAVTERYAYLAPDAMKDAMERAFEQKAVQTVGGNESDET